MRKSAEIADDFRQRRARTIRDDLGRSAYMDKAGDLFMRSDTELGEQVAVIGEPAGQPARTETQRRRGDDEVFANGSGGEFLLPDRDLDMRRRGGNDADDQ